LRSLSRNSYIVYGGGPVEAASSKTKTDDSPVDT
jgi:hypothetical protein